MTITEDIVNWAKSRPVWQQRILQILAEGNPITEAEMASVIDQLIAPEDGQADIKPLDLALAPADEDQAALVALRENKGINALVDEQGLEFSTTGINIVYGDNGSGKSGYARLIKDMVGARHPAEILPNVFEDAPTEPSAVLHYSLNGDGQEQKFPGVPDAAVKKMSFYDEHCGDAYLANKSVVTYRPSALILLDGLIEVCDRLRNAVSTRLVENQRNALDLGLAPETAGGAFLLTLDATTTNSAIDAATKPDPDAATKRAAAATEVARLETSNPSLERERLEALASAATAVAIHLNGLAFELNVAALETAEREKAEAIRLRTAAATVATADFEQELPGVGGETWRQLWRSARAYSMTEAYHGVEFPVTHDGARCVLCQQALDESGRDRLLRFDAYMRDTTERDAGRAEAVVAARLQRLRTLTVNSSEITTQLSRLKDVDVPLARSVNQALANAEATKTSIELWLSEGGATPQPFDITETLRQLETRAAAFATAASAVDVAAFQKSLTRARADRRAVEASIKLSESADALRAEVARLAEREALQSALSEVSTTSITAKSTQLTKLYAGDVIKNEFIRETERLHLQRVTIQDLGGNKGQLEQQPTLLGAKAAKVRAAQVLSEGEQTAMGLAGFFTEAAFDASRSALILDDPVTSLDHVRRSYVAARLAELAKDRQVIVFTHDVTFAGEIQKHADKVGVPVTPRSIERRGSTPGHIRESLPWKAKDFGARLQKIEQDFARLAKERDDYGQDDWDKVVGSWAGDLSELWESCVCTEILDEVFDRGTSEVRVMKFRILAAVSQEDDKEFQNGYGACSKWARRHNKSPETNYVPPEPSEMKAEIDRIREWQKKVKKYR